MTTTEPAGVALVAGRRLKQGGRTVEPGEIFHVLDPARAAVLVRGNYARAAEEGAAAIAHQHEIETSSRARANARPAPPISLRDRPVVVEEPPPPRLDDERTLDAIHVTPLRRALVLAEARLARLEKACAPLLDALDVPEDATDAQEPQDAPQPPAPRRFRRRPAESPTDTPEATPAPETDDAIDIDNYELDEDPS